MPCSSSTRVTSEAVRLLEGNDEPPAILNLSFPMPGAMGEGRIATTPASEVEYKGESGRKGTAPHSIFGRGHVYVQHGLMIIAASWFVPCIMAYSVALPHACKPIAQSNLGPEYASIIPNVTETFGSPAALARSSSRWIDPRRMSTAMNLKCGKT